MGDYEVCLSYMVNFNWVMNVFVGLKVGGYEERFVFD